MRLTKNYGKPKSYSADRGFDAEKNRNTLKEEAIINAICPRSVPTLKERLDDDDFVAYKNVVLRPRLASVSSKMHILEPL